MTKRYRIGTQVTGLLLAVLTIFAAQTTAAENGRIAFAVGDDILSTNPDGNGTRRLADVGRKPKYSPDGTRIAYYDGGQIWVMNADGSEKKFVTSAGPLGSFRYLELSWSPNGGRIAFTCDVGICAVNPRKSNFVIFSLIFPSFFVTCLPPGRYCCDIQNEVFPRSGIK